MRQGGLNRLLTLQIDGQDKAVLVQEVQVHPVRGSLQHIDFLEVRLDEKVTVTVPSDSGRCSRCPGRRCSNSVVMGVEVSCLPTDIPDALEIDISGLAIGDTLLVKDIQAQEGVEIGGSRRDGIVHCGSTGSGG